MQFLDLTGLRELWAKIKAGDAKATTTVQGQSANGTDAYVSAVGTAQEGEEQDGHLNYVITLHNAASNADVVAAKEALYGGTIPTEDAVTISDLKDQLDTLSSTSNVTVEELATATDGYAKSYVVKQNGAQVGVAIDIPKDFLVKSGEVKTATASDNISGVNAGEKYLDFVVNSVEGDASDSHIYIPVKDLVDVYTAGNGLQETNNEFSIKVDTSGEFLSVGADGLKVSGVSTAINNTKSEVVGTSTDAASANTIYGAKAYADSLAAGYATSAQGALADTAIQSVTGESGAALNNTELVKVAASTTDNAVTITSTVKTQAVSTATDAADGLAVASDVKSYVDTAVSGKNVDAEGDTLVSASAADNKVTVAATEALTGAVSKANSAIQSVKVNGTALTADANKAVDVLVAEGATNGAIAVNGSDVPVHGLGSAAYTASTAYATAAQGTKADDALQSVSHGTDGTYVTTTVGTKANNDQSIGVAVKVQPMSTANDSAAETMGLAEASDVKKYIDEQAASGLSAIQSVSGETAVAAGDFINVSVEAATSGKAVTLTSHANVTTQAVASATSESNGLATALDVQKYVDSTTASLDSSIAAASITNKSANAVEAEPEIYVFTGIEMVDGALDSTAAGTTSVRLMGIPTSVLDTILV